MASTGTPAPAQTNPDADRPGDLADVIESWVGHRAGEDQEWMGHRDYSTTLIYAHYQPGEQEADLVERAFEGHKRGTKSSQRHSIQSNSKQLR